LVAFFPLTEGYSHREMNFFLQMLSTISGYIVPFFLYLFLSVLLFDLFLLFNLFVGVVSSETRKSYSFRFYIFSTMIIISVAVVVAGAINLNTIRVSKYKVDISRRHAKIDHLRVVFVADCHIKHNTSLRFIEQFVKKVNAMKPDIVLYGGDMVEGNRENETSSKIESALRNIHSKYGVFAVPGNHEIYGGYDQRNFFRKADIMLLCDTVIKIDNSFNLAGRNDQHFRHRKTENEILESASPDLPVIQMDHRPNKLDEVSRTTVDVQFSGHTHNGQLFPLNLITRRVYELSWGYKKIRNTHFFVTSGLRLWSPPVKTAGKSEIMLIDIQFK
jgi:uncharacterized protein